MQQHTLALASLITIMLTSPLHAVEFSDQLDVFGTLEVEYGNKKMQQADGTTTTETGSALSTGAFGAVIKPNEKFDLTTAFLYEEDLNAVATPLQVDEAFVTWHVMPAEKFTVSVGKKYLPFGKYDTAMVSDPLTLTLGETNRREVLQASTKNGHFSTTGYVFNSEAQNTDDKGKNKRGFGLGVRYETEQLSGGIDYMSNLTQSADANPKSVPGVSLHGSTQLGKVTLRGEYLTATKALPEKPAATHLEAAFDLQNNRTLALGWGNTKQAAQLELEKTAYGITYRQPLYKALTGAVELRQSKDYEETKTQSLTLQMAYEF